jgi:hypothetical protein
MMFFQMFKKLQCIFIKKIGSHINKMKTMFMNKEFEENFLFKCIWHEITTLYYLEYNGIIECDNHNIEMVKSMLNANDM